MEELRIDHSNKLGQGIEGEVFGCSYLNKTNMAVKIIKSMVINKSI